MQHLIKQKMQFGAKIKHHDRLGIVKRYEQENILIEYDDHTYSYIPVDNIDRLVNEGILSLMSSEEVSSIAQYKTNDVSILLVYLKDLINQSYPGSKKTRLAVIEKYSGFYGKPFSEGYLYKQYRKWIAAGQDVCSISNKNFSKRRSKFSEEELEFAYGVIDEYYLDPVRRNCQTVYDIYHSEHKMNFNNSNAISRSTFYQIIQNLDAYQVCILRKGRDVANTEFRNNKSYYVPNYPLEVIELDAVHLNLCVLDEHRKQVLGTVLLYLGIDRYTRSIVGFYLGIKSEGAGENTKHVIKLIQNIIYPKQPMSHCKNPWFAYGKPSIIILDAGPAFNNQKVIDVVQGFGCTHSVTPTRTPQKKPFIERMMRTLREHFASSIRGYLDKNDSNKLLPSNWREQNAFLTLSEITELFEYWVCDHYHTHAHRGLNGATPQQVWHQYYSQPGVIQPIVPDFNPRCFGVKYTGTIQGSKGIQYNYSFYNSDELQEFYHQQKTKNNKNPKVEFYIDEDSNPEVIWVDNARTRKFLMVFCTGLRDKPQYNPESSNLSMSSNIELSNKLNQLYEQKQKTHKANKRISKKKSAPPAKEISTDDICAMLGRALPEPSSSVNKNNEKPMINPNNIEPLDSY